VKIAKLPRARPGRLRGDGRRLLALRQRRRHPAGASAVISAHRDVAVLRGFHSSVRRRLPSSLRSLCWLLFQTDWPRAGAAARPKAIPSIARWSPFALRKWRFCRQRCATFAERGATLGRSGRRASVLVRFTHPTIDCRCATLPTVPVDRPKRRHNPPGRKSRLCTGLQRMHCHPLGFFNSLQRQLLWPARPQNTDSICA
jgi:hypothetical protein